MMLEAQDPEVPEPVVRHVRYRRGEVGESQRSVHLVREREDGFWLSVCGQVFTPSRMEESALGMPCMACAQRAALASQGLTSVTTVDEHGERRSR